MHYAPPLWWRLVIFLLCGLGALSIYVFWHDWRIVFAGVPIVLTTYLLARWYDRDRARWMRRMSDAGYVIELDVIEERLSPLEQLEQLRERDRKRATDRAEHRRSGSPPPPGRRERQDP